jgi:hypothetical protein
MVMPRVQAWERLNDPEYSGKLKMTEFYELLIKAGYDESTAQKAANQRGWDRLQAGVAM